MVVLLLLVFGVGVSLLLTEISVGLQSRREWLVASFMFIGYCIALAVGSQSQTTKHPQLYAVLAYLVIVSLGVILNRTDNV